MLRSTNARRKQRPDAVTGIAVPMPRAVPPDAHNRLRRLRALAWFLDRSIPIGRKFRIGVDPIIGLLPGAGDWIAALLSLYVLYEGARLGLRPAVLTRMAGNVLVETIVGAVPLVGDLFDFAWQANMRNVELIDRHYRPDLRPRSLRKIWVALLIFALIIAAIIASMIFLLLKALTAIVS